MLATRDQLLGISLSKLPAALRLRIVVVDGLQRYSGADAA